MLTRLLLMMLFILPLFAHAAGLEADFFTVRQDLRLCPSPVCGGFYVSKVNQASMRCADRQRLGECYVSDLDLSGLNLTEEQGAAIRSLAQSGKVLLRGYLRSQAYANLGLLGQFIATEVWEGAIAAAPAGAFYRVSDKGIVCIAAPCLTHQQELLNRSSSRDIAGVDFSQTGATEKQLELAALQMKQAGGVLAAGRNITVRGPAGRAKSLLAIQFYLPYAPASPQACYIGGCSGQICSGQSGVVSTCEFRPEYACYRTATCERVATGLCDWTPTEEVKRCVEKARADANTLSLP